MEQATALVKIESVPATVSINFSEVSQYLDKELERYQNVVVTNESLPADKKLATELNKRAGEIKRARIDKAKELKAPISDFEEQMKTLEQKYLDVRQQIDDQVKQFERKRLHLCSQQLDAYRTELRDSMGIDDVHYKAEFDDLIKLTNLTKGGALTRGAKEQLEYRVKEELADQERTESRLIKLENECLKAGLDAPMTRENVEAFLYADNATYDARLNTLIESELQRQQQARKRYDEQKQAQEMKQEAPNPQEHERINPLASVDPALVARVEQKLNPQPEQQQERAQPAPQAQVGKGKKAVTVRADFTVLVPVHIPEQAIMDKLQRLLADAGINSLDSLSVVGVQHEQPHEQQTVSQQQQGVF